MFLFKEDYNHLSLENYHLSTNNHSFVRMSRLLDKMGIDNNKFFLLLTQPELAKYDPHRMTDSSNELRLKIIYEMKINPWYGLREVIRIPEPGKSTAFILNRANLAIAWMYFNCIDAIVAMPRQHGKTIGVISLTTLLLYIIGYNFKFTMVAQGNILRKENVARLKALRDELPQWMLRLQPTKDVNNMESVSYESLHNSYNTFVGNSSPALADKSSRGITTPTIHWDEFAHLINNHVMYPIALGTTTAAVKSAKKNNELHGNIITTTVGDLGTKEGEYCHDLITSSLPFTEHLYDVKDTNVLRALVKANSAQVMMYAEFSHLQLGRTDEELAEIIARSKASSVDITNMEYKNVWKTAGSGTIFSQADILRLKGSIKEPTHTQYIDEFIISWYLPKAVVLDPARVNAIPMIIGTDSSENIGIDFTTFVFTDATNMVVVATCRVNTVNIIKVGVYAAKLLMRFNALWIPERNSTGVAIVDAVLLELESNNVNPFEVVYNLAVQYNDKYKNIDTNVRGISSKYRELFGRRTTAGATGRDFLYKTVFFKGIEEVSDYLNDRILINEITALKDKDGRIDHDTKGHDDMVVAWILCCFVAFFGENLHRYKIFKNNPGLLLSKLQKVKDVVQLRDTAITKEITELMIRRRKASSEAIKRGIDIKIRRLTDKLSPEDKDKLPDAQSISKLAEESNSKNKYNFDAARVQSNFRFA